VTLHKDDITDTVFGPITVDGVDQSNMFVTSNTCGWSLAAGASCTITLSGEVPAGAPEPLVNTVTVTHRGNADLSGESVSARDDHSVNLFQPAVGVTKVCDTLSKGGGRCQLHHYGDEYRLGGQPAPGERPITDSRFSAFNRLRVDDRNT
jgi:hypothetical protein